MLKAVVGVLLLLVVCCAVYAEDVNTDKWEVSGLAAVAPANKAGGCLSYEVYQNDSFRVWATAGVVSDSADGSAGGFFGADTDAYVVPLLSKWFSEHVVPKARYGVGYAVPSTDVMFFVRVPLTSF